MVTGRQKFITFLVKNKGVAKLFPFIVEEYEDYLWLKKPGYLESLKKSREQSKNGQVFTLEEVFEGLLHKKARKSLF